MADSYFIPYFITKNNLENQVIQKGQVFFEIEEKKIYIDYSDTERIEFYGDFLLPLPNPDGSDEGKILQVKDGNWTIVEADIEGGDGVSGATFIPSVSEDGIISWTNDKGLTNPQSVNIKGPQGEKGDPFTIAKVYTSIEEMNMGFDIDDVPEGGFVVIETGDINNFENARLYIKGSNGYNFLTDLSGAQGIQGPQGPKGDTGTAGTNGKDGVSATHSWNGTTLTITSANGTSSANLKGEPGKDGTSITITNISQNNSAGGTSQITFSDGKTISIINGSNGAKGDTGDQGISATHTWNGSVLKITSASGTTDINISDMLQEKLDAIPTAASKGAIF